MLRLRWPAAVFCAIALAVSAAGCGGSSATPTQPPLTNPNEILRRSIVVLGSETSVHLDGTLSGTVDADYVFGLMGYGSGSLSGNIKLNNASLTGDVDLAGQAARLSATFPTLFGLSAEVIFVDGYSYSRFGTSTGKYTKSRVTAPAQTSSAAPDQTLDVPGTIERLATMLGSPGVNATLNGSEKIRGRDSYHVTLSLPAELLSQALGAAAGAASAGTAAGAAASGLELDLAPIECWVYADTLQPAELDLRVGSTRLGNLDLSVTLSGYGQAVTIQAPPASQISTSG